MMNIVVLAGGLSPERDVSLSSGCKIANALMENGHRAILADLYMGLPGAVGFEDAYEKNKKDFYEYKVPEAEPDLEAIKKMRCAGAGADADDAAGAGGDDCVSGCGDGGFAYGAGADTNEEQLIGDGILRVCADADITFNALHGDIGENGKLQAVFDIYGIKYTGSGFEGSLLAMNKPLAKELMRLHGILTPEYMIVDLANTQAPGSVSEPPRGGGVPYTFEIANSPCGGGVPSPFEITTPPRGSGVPSPAATVSFNEQDIIDRIGFPCVIKPCGCGSSVGVSIVNDNTELDAALKYASLYEGRIMAERKIEGREFSVGVLGEKTLPPIEIIPRVKFYDYQSKYQPGATLEVCPAEGLAVEYDKAMRAVALKVHKILGLGGYSRLDLILDGAGVIYCLEINTLPGMTPTSLLPQEAAAAGIPYAVLCGRIIELAL